jgi:photosystem II stability/assembly factor-like uncharacterized protein
MGLTMCHDPAMTRGNSRPLRAVVAGAALALAGLALPGAARVGNDSWTPLGPPGGTASAFAVDPSHPGTVYAGTLEGYVFKSTNAGVNWAAASSGMLGALRIYALAVDPSNSGTVYAGTGSGVFKSTDGAVGWTLVAPGFVLSLAIDPSAPATVYAGGLGGVSKSSDRGLTWTSPSQPAGVNGVYSVAIDPSHPATLYAGENNGIEKSVDGGVTWTALPALSVPYFAVVVDPLHPATVYASSDMGVAKTTDGGMTWTVLPSSGLPGAAHLGNLAIDPRAPGTLYASEGFSPTPPAITGLGIYKTIDGGATWTAITSGPGATYVYALAIDPTNSAVIYAGNRTGIFKSTSAGAGWSVADDGFTAFSVGAAAIDPASSATLYAGTDGGGVFKSSDAGAHWSLPNPISGDVFTIQALAVDPSQTAIVYAGTDDGVFKSTDAGASWNAIGAGIPEGSSVYSLVIDPSHSATVYAGTALGLFRTTDGGVTWTSILDDVVPVLAIDPVATATLYVSTEEDLLKSTDGGATWAAIEAGLGPPGFSFNVTGLAIDPANTSTLYAVSFRGVFKSADAGATWVAMTCGLPIATFDSHPFYPLTYLAVDSRNPGTVYAGGSGVFKTVDGGASWNAIGSELSGVSVLSLVFDPRTSTLYAGTDGMGIQAFTDTGKSSPPATLCIDDHPGDGRFAVQVHFKTAQGGGLAGDGRAISLSSLGIDHGGLFWFFDPANPEMLIKVLDACAVDDRFWVFYSAGTNVGFTTTVVDKFTGSVATYGNPDMRAAPPVQDTAAFSCAGGSRAAPAPRRLSPQTGSGAPDLPERRQPAAAQEGACTPGPATLCIGERFEVEVAYETSQGGGLSGSGHAIALDSLGVGQGGLFWFFSPDNPEMLIKVIDGCALTGKYWVFYSAGTNVGLKVTVTDTRTDTAVVFTNPDRTAAPPVQDTSAFPCG